MNKVTQILLIVCGPYSLVKDMIMMRRAKRRRMTVTMISIMRLKTTKTESKIVCLINLALSVSLIV